MRHVVDVGYPSHWTGIDDDLFAIAGWSESAGCGFGVRDQQWDCSSKDEAEALATLIRTRLGLESVHDNTAEHYVVVYRESKYVLVYLLQTHDYREFWKELWHTVTLQTWKEKKRLREQPWP